MGGSVIVDRGGTRIYVFPETSFPVYFDSNSAELRASHLYDAAPKASGSREARREGAAGVGVGSLLYVGYRLEVRCLGTTSYEACLDLRGKDHPPHVLMAFDLDRLETDLGYTTNLTVEVPGPVQALTPHPGGGVYLSTRIDAWAGNLWSFDPASHTLRPLPLPPGVAPFVAVALAADEHGRLYGIGSRRQPGSQTIESFFFAYKPEPQSFEQLAPLPGWSHGALLAMPGGRIYLLWQDQLLLYQP